MSTPTENVGSLPRPTQLQEAIQRHDAGEIGTEEPEKTHDDAYRNTITRMGAIVQGIVSAGRLRRLATK
ncbi:hypothetical protein [Rhodovibrio sodomensis]|uniref:hypothetical protein n=1 Tax=Rhodovibrio sodomensis TaxID=1088 RepID=UPI00190543CA|nr:hypothetical protein [Rhodovibrio sodomensis]